MTHSTGQLQDAATVAPNRREADGSDVEMPLPPRAGTRRRSLLWRVWKDPRYDGLRTLLWVCPLTVMIWVYAEREQIDKRTLNGVPVTVVTGDPGRIVASVNRSSTPPTVSLIVSGPKEAIERVQERLLRGTDEADRVRIVLGNRSGAVGEHPVQVASEVFNLPIFRQNGITVEDAQPPDLLVSVAQMEEATLPVVLSDDARRRLNLDGAAQFEPPKVRVRAPYAVLHPLNRPAPAALYANLPDDADALLKPVGLHEKVLLQLAMPGAARDDHVTLSPATVSARFTVRAAEKTHRLPRTPVWVLAAPELTHDFDVVDYPLAIPIDVVGPPDVIDQLARDTDPQAVPSDPQRVPLAVLTLGREDVPNRAKAYTVQRLPPGVTVVPPADPTISYHLEPRKRAAGDGG